MVGYGTDIPRITRAMLQKSSNIMRTVHNYILTGKNGKTPAVRLGLAQAPLDYEDIIYFSSTD